MLSPSGRLPALAAILLASCVTASTIRTATFIAWGTDPANYVITAKRWARADVFGPNPLELGSPQSSAGVALGNRQGLTPGTDISIYPLGFPVVLAAADLVNPEFGVYLVPPIFLGVLVLATAGPWGGLFAAAMTAATPIALAHTVTVMSDRFDLLDPPAFDAMLDVLVRRGYHPVFLIDQENEGAIFKERFPASKYRRLDWRPRAMFIAGTTLWYLDFADRDRGRDPVRAPTDVLR